MNGILLVKNLFWISMVLIAHTYIFYPIILICVKKKKSFTVIQGEFEPTVTLIVSAYNEEKVIRAKIENCLKLDYPGEKLEIIIASDGSSDGTSTILDEYRRSGINVQNYEYRSGKVNVLNRVIPNAQSEIIVLSDANTMYQPNAIRMIVNRFGDKTVGCVCGKLVLRKSVDANGGELEGVYWRYENYLKELEGEHGALLGANGGIYAFRKELFEPIPANTVVDDFVIPMKILIKGHKVVYEPMAIAYEETSKDLAGEHVRKIRIGAGAYQALFQTLPMLNITRGFPSFAYWSHKVLRWGVPFFMIVLLITNILLLNEKFYNYFYMAQALFYCCALFGFPINKTLSRLKLFSLAYYFVSMNLCLLFGFIRFATKTQKVTWERISR